MSTTSFEAESGMTDFKSLTRKLGPLDETDERYFAGFYDLESVEELNAYFSILHSKSPRIRCAVLLKFFCMRFQHSKQIKLFLTTTDWPRWFLPWLMTPNAASWKGDDEINFTEQDWNLVYGLIMTLITHILSLAVQEIGTIGRFQQLNMKTFLQNLFSSIANCAGWTEDTLMFTRLILWMFVNVLSVKWTSGPLPGFDTAPWQNLFEVFGIIKEFMFFRPAIDSGLVQTGKEKPQPALHLDARGCLDLPLVEKVVELLTGLVSKMEVHVLDGSPKQEKAMVRKLADETQFFVLIFAAINPTMEAEDGLAQWQNNPEKLAQLLRLVSKKKPPYPSASDLENMLTSIDRTVAQFHYRERLKKFSLFAKERYFQEHNAESASTSPTPSSPATPTTSSSPPPSPSPLLPSATFPMYSSSSSSTTSTAIPRTNSMLGRLSSPVGTSPTTSPTGSPPPIEKKLDTSAIATGEKRLTRGPGRQRQSIAVWDQARFQTRIRTSLAAATTLRSRAHVDPKTGTPTSSSPGGRPRETHDSRPDQKDLSRTPGSKGPTKRLPPPALSSVSEEPLDQSTKKLENIQVFVPTVNVSTAIIQNVDGSPMLPLPPSGRPVGPPPIPPSKKPTPPTTERGTLKTPTSPGQSHTPPPLPEKGKTEDKIMVKSASTPDVNDSRKTFRFGLGGGGQSGSGGGSGGLIGVGSGTQNASQSVVGSGAGSGKRSANATLPKGFIYNTTTGTATSTAPTSTPPPLPTSPRATAEPLASPRSPPSSPPGRGKSPFSVPITPSGTQSPPPRPKSGSAATPPPPKRPPSPPKR